MVTESQKSVDCSVNLIFNRHVNSTTGKGTVLGRVSKTGCMRQMSLV